MAGYSDRYGPSEVAAFRSGEQALTGSSFPLLADRRYAVVMDGQWRVRDIAAAITTAKERGEPIDEYAVTALPTPPGGRTDAGWVNGNFFVVPRQAGNKRGAWEFMKFWIGFDDRPEIAAKACAAGGWIPVSTEIVEQPRYVRALEDRPLLREFVRLAGSPNQVPVPALPVASAYYQQVNQAAQEVMYRGGRSQTKAARGSRIHSRPTGGGRR